ncbi:MAG: class I SAM-dependent methyltransferase [bacterium]
MKTNTTLFAEQFDAVASYYDEIMSVVPYAQWVKYLHRIMERHGWTAVHDILDVATGTGTVAFMLAEQGFRVLGVDIAPRMIEIAQQKAAQNRVGEVSFLCQDATRLSLQKHDFDLAICLFDSLNYIITSHGIQQVFAGVYSVLKPGGGFIFDLNSEYTLEKNLFTQDNFWDEDAKVKHIWNASYNMRTRMATVEMEYYLPDGRCFREVHKERAHRHRDVLQFLAAAGFTGVEAYDAYSFLPAGIRSERIFYVAHKPE